MKQTPWRRLLICWCLVTLCESPPTLLAEDEPHAPRFDPYIAVFGGAAFPAVTDIRVEDPSRNASFTALDAELNNSVSVGGKVGAWFSDLRKSTGLDYGLELDVTNYRPDVKSGLFNATGSFNGAPVSLVGKAAVTDVNATIVAVNVLLRLPLAVSEEFPNGRIYPYVGGGAGIQRTIYGPEDKETKDLAFQGLAGVHMMLWQRVGLFAEYKLTHARQTFSITGQEQTMDFTVNHAVVGLAVHFGP